jgi:TRAP-type C4-dicarboxylate transport system permease small subunit
MMFGMFMWGIFCRYVLKASATYANEIQIMGYLWTVLPAALWARRRNDHVCFSMLYDSLNPRGQRWIRILGNLFMTVMYIFLLSGSIKFILNLRQKSMALQIPLKVLYLPFPILVAGILLYSLWDLYTDVRDIVLESTGRKEKLSNEKIDKAEEFRKASEEEYQRLFAGLEQERETVDGGSAPGKEE